MTETPIKFHRNVLLALIALMAVTRSHHFASLAYLPDASWAVFFLAGFYLRDWKMFGGMLVLAALIDVVAIEGLGVSSYCVSAAYPFLVPAYGTLWWAGRSYSGHYRLQWGTLLPLAAFALLGVATCELISGASFYFLSGRLVEVSLVGYGVQFAHFFPGSLQGFTFYLVVAGVAHVFLTLAGNLRQQVAPR